MVWGRMFCSAVDLVVRERVCSCLIGTPTMLELSVVSKYSGLYRRDCKQAARKSLLSLRPQSLKIHLFQPQH